MDEYIKEKVRFIVVIFLVVFIIAMIISMILLFFSDSSKQVSIENSESNANTSSLQNGQQQELKTGESDKKQDGDEAVKSEEPTIQNINNESVKQDLSNNFDLNIDERYSIDDWVIIKIAPVGVTTDPAIVIYKKVNQGYTRVIGPGTSFSKEQIINRGVPQNVMDNHLMKIYIRR